MDEALLAIKARQDLRHNILDEQLSRRKVIRRQYKKLRRALLIAQRQERAALTKSKLEACTQSNRDVVARFRAENSRLFAEGRLGAAIAKYDIIHPNEQEHVIRRCPCGSHFSVSPDSRKKFCCDACKQKHWRNKKQK